MFYVSSLRLYIVFLIVCVFFTDCVSLVFVFVCCCFVSFCVFVGGVGVEGILSFCPAKILDSVCFVGPCFVFTSINIYENKTSVRNNVSLPRG